MGEDCDLALSVACAGHLVPLHARDHRHQVPVFDLWLMLAFGLLGFAAKEAVSGCSMVLGVVLGRNIETYFRQSAIIGFEKISSHPVCIVAIALGLLMLIIFTVFKGRVYD